jgi:hypothetical protein
MGGSAHFLVNPQAGKVTTRFFAALGSFIRLVETPLIQWVMAIAPSGSRCPSLHEEV